jgi:signal transduction histidine kinase
MFHAPPTVCPSIEEDPPPSSARRGLQGIVRRLFAAHPSVQDQATRRNARLLATLSALGCAMSWLGVGATLGFQRDRSVAFAVTAVLVPGALMHAWAYVLARGPRPTRAAPLEVLAFLVIPTLITLLMPPELLQPLSTATWFAWAIFLAGALLGARTACAAACLGLAVTAGAAARAASALPPEPEPFLLLVFAVALVVAFTRHRDALEAIRMRLLEERTRSLEALRASLEERVAARTAELSASRTALEAAYKNLKDNHDALIVTEKLAAVGRLTAGMAHEMSSPLSAVMAALDDASELVAEYDGSIDDPEVRASDHREIAADLRRAVLLAGSAAGRLVGLVRGIRGHTRNPSPGKVARFPVDAMVRDAVTLLAYAARDAKARLETEAVQSVTAVGSPERLSQALVNLLSNAIDAVGSAGGGRIRIALVKGQDGMARLSVADDGPGIAAEDLPRIFDLFFTTKPHGKGTGLGLPITREIVEDDFGGTLEVRTGTDGTVFTMVLPDKEGIEDAA